MINIILLCEDYKKIMLVKHVVSSIDFHIGEKILFSHHNFNIDNMHKIHSNDFIKIFIVDLDDSHKSCEIIRNIKKIDNDSPIIFIASSKHILDQYYGIFYSIFTHLVIDESFNQELKLAIINLIKEKFDKGVFTYSNRYLNLNIYYKKILYIYRDTHTRKTIVVTNNNEYPLNISLKEIINYLDQRFRKCHRACIVNKRRVENYGWNDGYFILDNGKQINLLSKNYIKEVNKN